VNGTLKNISAFPDPIKTGTESLLAKVFNILTILVLSPLQPRDLGQGQDADCDALIATVFRRGIRRESFSRIFKKEMFRRVGPLETTRDRELEAQRRVMITLSKRFIVLPRVWELSSERRGAALP
jgi:hypothetical protein